MLTCGITHTQPYWDNAKVGASGLSVGNVPGQDWSQDWEMNL